MFARVDGGAPAFGLSGASFPEKIEGIAFGPDLPDGRHTLVITNDNDFLSTSNNNFYVFAIDPGDLSYVAQAIHAVPEPSTLFADSGGPVRVVGDAGAQRLSAFCIYSTHARGYEYLSPPRSGRCEQRPPVH